MSEPTHAQKPRLRVVFLGSGSSGNATAVSYGDTTVLVDAGFSAREILRRLEAAGLDASSVRAIVVTHEHGDHIRGVRVVAKRLGDVPVYATPGTRAAASLDSATQDPRDLVRGESVQIGELELAAFRTLHDAAEPVGVRFDAPDGESYGHATDTGELTPEALEALAGCRLVGIECNHDIGMLVNGPYPRFLKERILSPRGHLSNAAAATGIAAVAHDGLRAVAALHLSSQNNAPEHARRALAQTLARLDHGATVTCARQDAACTFEGPSAGAKGEGTTGESTPGDGPTSGDARAAAR